MVIRAAAYELQSSGEQNFGERFRVIDNLATVLFELGPHRFGEADRLAGDDVHERTALDAGKHSAVDRFAVLFFGKTQAGARTAKRFVRGRSYEISDGH